MHHSLVHGSLVIQSKGHGAIAKGTYRDNEGGLLIVLWAHVDLAVS